jgi:hypothetical protein
MKYFNFPVKIDRGWLQSWKVRFALDRGLYLAQEHLPSHLRITRSGPILSIRHRFVIPFCLVKSAKLQKSQHRAQQQIQANRVLQFDLNSAATYSVKAVEAVGHPADAASAFLHSEAHCQDPVAGGST